MHIESLKVFCDLIDTRSFSKAVPEAMDFSAIWRPSRSGTGKVDGPNKGRFRQDWGQPGPIGPKNILARIRGGEAFTAIGAVKSVHIAIFAGLLHPAITGLLL